MFRQQVVQTIRWTVQVPCLRQAFSWTSVWDSVRLSSREKRRLLELFVVPVYRQRFDTSVGTKSRERF
ncbi:protein of unknown function [Ralstonia solanacearum CMR15]|nr:protein of unknown function [Ralstonia solanacearum CMR15]